MNEKLSKLRALMKTYNLEAYIIPNTDPHQSEYIAAHWQSLAWLSNFTGSAGTLVITHHFAGLWTDSRYFLQAEEQLEGTGIELMRMHTQDTPQYADWLAANLKEKSEVGFNGKLFSIAQVEQMRKTFAPRNIQLVASGDLIKMIWTDRPPLPETPIFPHPIEYAGKSKLEKLAEIRELMKGQKADYHLLTALDDIAWTFNLRGSDVECNPVAMAYALIGQKTTRLYIKLTKVPNTIKTTLAQEGIEVFDYEQIAEHLKYIDAKSTVLLSKGRVSQWLFNSIPTDCKIISDLSLPTILKSKKNKTEIHHIRATMAKDGVAMVRFLKWLEDHIGKIEITELSASEQLEAFRKEQEQFVGNSFAAISGYNEHGAIVHYRVTPESDIALAPQGIYLIDSGGQYLDGTTDITRTLALGTPSGEAKTAYTAVLKAHIAVATAIFPKGTTGQELHAICKYHMWQKGLDFGHGTGHGVGFFLNVHEGPQRIGNGGGSNIPFEVGMLTSNEPGYYKTGAFGMRIENLIITENAPYEDFLQFETVTLCPIDTRLINIADLSLDEKNWLNGYHQMVFDRLAPFLKEEEISWLKQKTAGI